MTPSFTKKDAVKLDDFAYASPYLLIALAHTIVFFSRNKLPLVITSMFTDPVEGRVSKSHEEGRALDISVRDLWQKDIEDYEEYMQQYNELGAFSKDGKQRLVVVHDAGSGNHIHLQVKRGV